MSLVGFMKLMPVDDTNSNSDKKEKGLARFEKIRGIGKGAAGVVDLVRVKATGEQYALKRMELSHMTDKQ